MRPIEFRVWDVKKQKMIFIDPSKDINGICDLNETPTWKLMQFTGLKDKQGKKIYEGDIVKYDYNSTPIEHCIGKVYFETELACWKFGNYVLEPTIKKTLEVLGNEEMNLKI